MNSTETARKMKIMAEVIKNQREQLAIANRVISQVVGHCYHRDAVAYLAQYIAGTLENK